jgi:hypothetical protein
MLPMNAATAGWQQQMTMASADLKAFIIMCSKHKASIITENEKAPTAEVVQQMQYTYIHKEKWLLMYLLF